MDSHGNTHIYATHVAFVVDPRISLAALRALLRTATVSVAVEGRPLLNGPLRTFPPHGINPDGALRHGVALPKPVPILLDPAKIEVKAPAGVATIVFTDDGTSGATYKPHNKHGTPFVFYFDIQEAKARVKT